jgi:glycosyltransferase involved in cell wall biosynthesis
MYSKDKILILFEGGHLAYSPTVLQLYDELKKNYSVTIIAEKKKSFSNQNLLERNVIYYEYIKKVPRLVDKISLILFAIINKEAKLFLRNKIKFQEFYFKFRMVKKVVLSNQFKRIIAVDLKNLFYCSVLKQRVDLISLELGLGEKLLSSIDTSLINCVIIQTKERFNYLFNGNSLKTFYIQNAPAFKEITYPSVRKGLLYGGTAWDAFGFYHCLNYLKIFKAESLTVQGAVPVADRKKIKKGYGDLINEKRLIINEEYVENDALVDYFTQFEIGLCFYNFKIKWINHFNYKSAPSGKLFKYLAAGVPVVCSDISGFKFVQDFKCGVLVADLIPEKINEAIIAIRNNYQEYVGNAISAAKHFSFDKTVRPYIEFIRRG